MSKKQKTMLVKIIISMGLLSFAVFADFQGVYGLVSFLIPYFILGYKVLKDAVMKIFRGMVLDENFLMSIATIGAFIIGEYAEAVAVMLFYSVGTFFESYAVGKSRKSIAGLMDIRPDTANIEKDGEIISVSAQEITVGSIITVKAGDKVPLDGQIIEGSSMLDTSALTGESVPRKAVVGDDILSGCVNLNGLLRIKTTKEFGESTVSKILELVENASSKKAKTENFITQFAKWYTPCVVVAALLVAVLPPLLLGESFSKWIMQGLVFLVVSCPCALVISIPLSFFGGIGGASRQGILIKGSNYLEALAKAKTIVFDKTGTLTKGEFAVTEIHAENGNEEFLLKLTAEAEHYSDHPIASSIKKANKAELEISNISDTKEIAGFGIEAVINGDKVYVGNDKLMALHNIVCPNKTVYGTVLHVASNGIYLGYIVISDKIKDEAIQAISELKKLGIEKCVMLSGDKKDVAETVAREIGISTVFAELLPADKVEHIETLLKEQKKGETLVFVGDGINDAPVLARVDIGVAMGAIGADAAIESADVVLMQDNLTSLVKAVKISRKTLGIARQNIIFALGVKAVVLALGVAGVASMWLAIFADVGVSVIAILNATRALKKVK